MVIRWTHRGVRRGTGSTSVVGENVPFYRVDRYKELELVSDALSTCFVSRPLIFKGSQFISFLPIAKGKVCESSSLS